MRLAPLLFSLTLFAIGTPTRADLINFPTNWWNQLPCTGDGSVCGAEAIDGSPTQAVDIPHAVAVQMVAKTGWGVRLATPRLGMGTGAHLLYTGQTVSEAFTNVYGKNSPMKAYWNWNGGHTDWPDQLCFWAGETNNWKWVGTPEWKGPCVPIQWGQQSTSCSVNGPDVLLDHGVITAAEGNVAYATATVHCTGNASGHLALPDGGDTIRFAVGYSKLSSDIGPISKTRPFAKGDTPIELKSTLHDVEPGTRTSSAAIIVVLD